MTQLTGTALQFFLALLALLFLPLLMENLFGGALALFCAALTKKRRIDRGAASPAAPTDPIERDD